MKRRFVSYILIFTSLMLIILSGCALLDNCSFNSSEIYASGDVLYCYIDEVGGRSRIRGKNVAICDLTNKGYEKEIIILPDELDGKPVIQLGHCDFMYQSSIGSYTQKIYLPPTILGIAGDVGGKLFLIDELSENFYICMPTDYNRIHVSQSIYDKYEGKFGRMIPYIANTEYIVDGETYWLDDYDEPSLITAPENPVKEGYEFAGWFKEPELENEWNFETDMVTGKTYDDDGEENINLTRLYAKWQKI